MSWYSDPELFIYYRNPVEGYWIAKITKKHNSSSNYDYYIRFLQGRLDFSQHLSLGNNINKESDYDALKSILVQNSLEVDNKKVMNVNCEGQVIYWNHRYDKGSLGRLEGLNLVFVSLHSRKILAEKQAVDGKISELLAEISSLKEKLNSEVTNLQEQLNQEKNDKLALQTQVLDLTAKLKESRGAGSAFADAEPWMSGCNVPSNWVSFEELDVLNIPRDTPLVITEAPGAPKIVEDTTTNVQANCFCQGIFPVVVVNVADLIPNNGMARFDPDIWCSINSAGKCYAARKLSESEMLVSPHKTG